MAKLTSVNGKPEENIEEEVRGNFLCRGNKEPAQSERR